MSLLLRSVLPATAVAALAASATAQTLYTWDPTTGVVSEYHGGPDPGTCGYPTGPGLSSFPVPSGSLCPEPLPIGVFAPTPGGVAYDSATDTVLVSDGSVVARYTTAGGFLGSVLSPLPVFGMGMDSLGGLLWCTDGGALAYALTPPPAGACGAVAVIAVPPFAIPGPGPFLDIDWEPVTGSLFACSFLGIISNFLPGGATGPFGMYPVLPGGCFVVPLILGLAVHDGAPPGTLLVSNGFATSVILPGGAPAPPTFTFPFPCAPNPAPTRDLAFAAHGVPYGLGVDPDGLAAPVATTVGASTTPSSLFAHTLASAVPGGIASLVLSTGFACPAFPVLGVPAFISPFGPTPVLATVPVGPLGTAFLPTPIPPGVALGVPLFDQWFVLKPLGPSPLQISNAVTFTTSSP
jgi:hypothetical protein